MGAVARWSGFRGSMFFFEKKNQKTFTCAVAVLS
jgi:hypothetical protein